MLLSRKRHTMISKGTICIETSVARIQVVFYAGIIYCHLRYIVYKFTWPNTCAITSAFNFGFPLSGPSFSVMEDEVILLNFWLSPYGTRVQIALEEKGIKYECKEEDLSNKSPLLLQMNPVHKKIPVLIHNGKPICESLIAVEYIDGVWGDKSPPLLPSDPYQRAQARFWADYVDRKIYEIAMRFWKTEGEEKDAAKKELLECLEVLEEQLGDKPYFGGDNLGFVDVALVPFFSWFYTYNFSGRFNFINQTQLPNITAWAKRCTERDCVSKCFPEKHRVKEYLQQRKVLDTE